MRSIFNSFGFRQEHFEAHYSKRKEILANYEGVKATSEVVANEAQLLLVSQLYVLNWMCKGNILFVFQSKHYAY